MSVMYHACGEAHMWESIKFHGRKAMFCVSATEKIVEIQGKCKMHCQLDQSTCCIVGDLWSMLMFIYSDC